MARRNIGPRESRGYLKSTHRVVRDFDTLEHLVSHAAHELGATHVSGDGPTTKIFFPRGGQHPYEAASVRRKGGYWHADGPGAREGVASLPAGAKALGGAPRSRRAAEAKRDRRRDQYVYAMDLRVGDFVYGANGQEYPVVSISAPDPTTGNVQVDLMINGVSTPRYFYQEQSVAIKRRATARATENRVAARSRIEIVTYSMPVYWASYLINGDASGIDDDEIAEADAAIEDIGLGAPVDVGESEFRSRGDYGHLAGDYADYTFHKIEKNGLSTSVRDYEAVDSRDRRIAGPFKSYGDAKQAAGTGGHVKYVRPSEARAPRRKGPEAAGSEYAGQQIKSEYFDNWVRDQLIEASKMPEDQMLPLETPDDARKIARNMLQQLEWDAKRDPGDAPVPEGEEAAFWRGFHKYCMESVPWLADELLTLKREYGLRETPRKVPRRVPRRGQKRNRRA